MEFPVSYIIFGIFLHFLILFWVIKNNHLEWPSGILIASIFSFIIYLAHIYYWLVLISFFIPSAILSKLKIKEKKNPISSFKTSKRNGNQVIANSLGLFFFSILQILESGISGEIINNFYLAGSLYVISASSDTWSSEIGTMSNSIPRNILKLKNKLPKGSSGGITLVGSLGGLLGSIVVSSITIFFLFSSKNSLTNKFEFILLLLIFLGFIGQMIDSFLGASFQKKYYCPQCKIYVEDSFHIICDKRDLNKSLRYSFLDNNTVNLVSNMIISLVGFFYFSFLFLWK